MTELASPKTRSRSDPLAGWAQKRIRLDGRPFRFEGHEYLRAIYDDPAQHVVISKAAQVGGTTYGILRSFHACVKGLDVIYFFPTHRDVLDFSRSRVAPLLRDNAFLARHLTDTDTVGLKQIGEANLYFRGMQSTVQMKSVPADMIAFDELDEVTPEARAIALERLSHSEYKRIIELSNPSLPDYGIDEQYQLSDQSHWTLKCPSCSERTCLEKEFPKKLGEEVRIILPREDDTYYRACPKCSAELDLDAGEWVADFPDRPTHGYRISQLFSSRVDPGEILREYRTTRYPDRFFNLKIGVPWADLERRLDIMSVLSLCSDYEPQENRQTNPCFMGVDTGKEFHVVVLEQPNWEKREPLRVVHIGVYHSFEDLDKLMKRFQPHCVIDGLPETHATREFAHRHGGWVHLCFFTEGQRGKAAWDLREMIVQVNRTDALDGSRAAIRNKEIVLPRRSALVEEFARHMACDAKVLDEDEETGAKKYRYIKTAGENHFSMAFTYAWIAAEENAMYGCPIAFA